MIKTDRLLTVDEADGLDNFSLLEFQDAKTLKAVGVWLDSINFADYDIQGVIASFQHYSVESLKEGRIPDE